MSASLPGSVGPAVVVGSSQLITTLSALAYLRWRGIRASVVRVVSLKAGGLPHSSSAFEHELSRLALAEGHHCFEQSSAPWSASSASLSCALLLLPRLDDQEGQRLLSACRAQEVVELGESIGVETRLYSWSSRRARQRALQALVASHGADAFALAPLIPIQGSVELRRLRCLLEVCAAFRQQITAAEPSVEVLVMDGVLVCLPYLKVRSWWWRITVAGRQLGWRRQPQLLNLSYIRAALEPVFKRPFIQTVWVQAHPKNDGHRDLIQDALQPLAASCTLQLLDGAAPLELLLTRQRKGGLARSIVAGFGTNLLSAAVFLYPDVDRVQLCEAPHGRGLGHWWPWLNTVVFQRRERSRRRHVRATLSNLRQALQQLDVQ